MPHLRKILSASTTVALCLICGASAAVAQNAIRGTVYAPTGEDIRGTMIIACYMNEGSCDDGSPYSKAIMIETSGPSAAYAVRDLEPGNYLVFGLYDLIGNNAEDPEDWFGVYEAGGLPVTVQVPSEGIDVWLEKPLLAREPTAASPVDSSGRSPKPGSRIPGSLEGIYVGVTKNLIAPGPGSPIQQGFTWMPGRDWLTFFPDGRLYYALPEEGMAEPFDWGQECQPHPSWCATYSVDGDQVRIRWDTGDEKVFHLDEGGILWTEDRLNYLPLPKLDGLRLGGRYQIPWKDYMPTWIQFTPEGRFIEENLLQETSWRSLDTSPQIQAIREVTSGEGAYQVRANTLELQYDDGRAVRIALYILPDQLEKRQPEEIYINAFDFNLMP